MNSSSAPYGPTKIFDCIRIHKERGLLGPYTSRVVAGRSQSREYGFGADSYVYCVYYDHKCVVNKSLAKTMEIDVRMVPVKTIKIKTVMRREQGNAIGDGPGLRTVASAKSRAITAVVNFCG